MILKNQTFTFLRIFRAFRKKYRINIFWKCTVVTVYAWLLQDICFSLNKVKYWILLSWHGNLNPEYSEESIVLYMYVYVCVCVYVYVYTYVLFLLFFIRIFLLPFFCPRQKIDFAQSLNKIWTSQSSFRMRTFKYSNSRRVEEKYRSWKTWRYILYWEMKKYAQFFRPFKLFIWHTFFSDNHF